jgi:hypothetical protein
MNKNKLLRRIIFSLIGLVAALAIADAALMNAATTVISKDISPDGKWEAVVMVRNPGAADGFATTVAIQNASLPFRSLRAVLNRGDFTVNDNNHAVPVGDKGQISVRATWLSNQALRIEYPHNAEVTKQLTKVGIVAIRYAST